VYINDLPLHIDSLAEPVLYADDTVVIISNENFIDFTTSANQVLASMTEWFSANKLVLNMEKTNIMKFVTINQPYCALTVSYLSVACYIFRQMYHICKNDTLRLIYFVYFHSVAS